MDVTVDIRAKSEHREWIDLCKTVGDNVDSVDGMLLMTSETHFYFDAAEMTGVSVSEEIGVVLKEEGYENVVVSVTGFSHLQNITDHMNTKEIRVTNSITN